MRFLRNLSITIIIAMLFTSLTGCSGLNTKEESDSNSDKQLIIGGTTYTEQFIVSELLATLVEEKMPDVKVVRKQGLNGTMVVHSAMTNGDIDAAVEYIGSGLMQILHKDLIRDPDEAYKVVKDNYHDKWHIKWLKPLGFNNTYAMVVKKDYAKAHGLKNSSDLSKVASDITLGCSMEFSERPDGYPGWKKAYGIDLKDIVPMDSGIMYSSIKNGEVNAISAFATDGRIPEFDLQVLEDDKKFFPPYYAVPMIREEKLKEIPGLEELINKLGDKISDKEMMKLNAKVDIDGMEPHEVAKEFLKENNLI